MQIIFIIWYKNQKFRQINKFILNFKKVLNLLFYKNEKNNTPNFHSFFKQKYFGTRFLISDFHRGYNGSRITAFKCKKRKK